MAEKAAGIKLGTALMGFGSLPIVRQLTLMSGLAASIALGVVIVMWSQQPNFSMLYSGLSDQDSLEITAALDRAGVSYKLGAGGGTVLVPGDKVHEARMKLAGQGLPKGTATGFDLLDKDQGFGVSQFMENARYQRALEGELEQTIASMSNVRSARVHLAIPKQSAFVREHKDPSASVLLDVFGGRTIEAEQVAAVVHLVASSVPNLSPDKVTVVDQTGKLLTGDQSSDQLRLSASQFDYRKNVEDYYTKRIEDILSPVLGPNGVRAQVSADIDFTVTEQTQENFNPDLPAVRSEQTYEDHSSGAASAAAGIPGALSNQPPATAPAAAASAKPAVPAAPAAGAAGTTNDKSTAAGPENSVRRVTRNYELDKTISHTQFQTGTVRKLSIAVVVDDRQKLKDDGTVERIPRTEEELSRYTALVKEAIGFNAERGDSVNVVNASFTPPPAVEVPPEPKFFEKPWVWDVAKQVAAGIGVILLVFGVLRPLLRSLVEKAPAVSELPAAGRGREMLPAGGVAHAMQGQLPAPNQYEQQLGAIKGMASQDPKRVAQVVKTWVATDG
jgi:flagellar M-ring protein FliF